MTRMSTKSNQTKGPAGKETVSSESPMPAPAPSEPPAAKAHLRGAKQSHKATLLEAWVAPKGTANPVNIHYASGGGNTLCLPDGLYRVGIVKQFDEEEIGLRYIGHLLDEADVDLSRALGVAGFTGKAPDAGYDPRIVTFGPTPLEVGTAMRAEALAEEEGRLLLTSIARLEATLVKTRRLLRLWSNDYDEGVTKVMGDGKAVLAKAVLAKGTKPDLVGVRARDIELKAALSDTRRLLKLWSNDYDEDVIKVMAEGAALL